LTALVAGVAGAANGAAAGAAITLRSTTRRERRARARERRPRATAPLAEMGDLAGGLAHEIKNPLSTIGLNAQLLAESIHALELPPDARGPLLRRIDTLTRETDRLRGILADFLEFAGGLHLQPVEQNVNTVVDQLVDFFAPQAEQARVRLRTTLAPRRLDAPIDAPLIKQALLNLMLNAVQAMAEHPGELIIRTEPLAEPDGSDAVAIHVIDTGPGMDAATRAKVFQPYFTSKAGGSGLGLPTARRLIEAHGGRLDLFSEPGKGTDARVVLPTALDAH
jgi:signal transduction histidine kinase